MREARLLGSLADTMKRAGVGSSFFDSWMKEQSDLVQASGGGLGGLSLDLQVVQVRGGTWCK